MRASVKEEQIEFSVNNSPYQLEVNNESECGLLSSFKVCLRNIDCLKRNIARGTTDPEIDSVTWIKFSKNMAPLALVANLPTRWRHLYSSQMWPPDGAFCIFCKFGHQIEPLALGKPCWTNSAVFLNIVQGGWGVKPMFKNFVANILLF